MGTRIDVIQDLRVFDFECDGDELRVDIYGGPDCACGTLIYRFADQTEREERGRLLRLWRDRCTSVTFVSRDESGTLVDERSSFLEALNA